MKEWIGEDGMLHLGLIDENDPYMQLRLDDYPGNIKKLEMFNFKRDKTVAYERAQNAINQGLVIFPESLNGRNELEFEETDAEGIAHIRYETPTEDEKDVLIQFDLAKEELIGMQKIKKPNGTVTFDLSNNAKKNNMHDDHADCVAMILNRLMILRAEEALGKEQPKSDFNKMFVKVRERNGSNNGRNSNNPFGNKANPFNLGRNPFRNR